MKKEPRLLHAATAYRALVGSIIRALEFYDADDGHNQLVLDGIVARVRAIEVEFDDLLLTEDGRQRRREA